MLTVICVYSSSNISRKISSLWKKIHAFHYWYKRANSFYHFITFVLLIKKKSCGWNYLIILKIKLHQWNTKKICMYLTLRIYIYYIPINVISLNTVDFIECDPMLRITTLWLSEYITPLLSWWRRTQCFSQYTMHEVLRHHSYGTVQICTKYTLSVSKWSLQILLLNINASLWCI